MYNSGGFSTCQSCAAITTVNFRTFSSSLKEILSSPISSHSSFPPSSPALGIHSSSFCLHRFAHFGHCKSGIIYYVAFWSGFLAQCFEGSPMLFMLSTSFFLTVDKGYIEGIDPILFTHQLVNILSISLFELLPVMLLWIFAHRFLYRRVFLFLSGMYVKE